MVNNIINNQLVQKVLEENKNDLINNKQKTDKLLVQHENKENKVDIRYKIQYNKEQRIYIIY